MEQFISQSDRMPPTRKGRGDCSKIHRSSCLSSSTSRRFPGFFALWFLAAQAQDYTCDLQADRCPSQQNGVCESSFGLIPSNDPSCRDGDCFDCNILCGQFNYDCTGCLTAIGCFWCPGDGTCNNSPNYLFFANSSCNSAEDYIAGPNASRCLSTESLFR